MKRSKILAMLSACTVLAASLTGCGSTQIASTDLMAAGQIVGNTAEEDIPLTSAFLKEQTDFALRLTQQELANADGNNLLLSPYSVMQALAMTANGAGGETRTEMEKTLSGEYSDYASDVRNKMLSAFRKSLSDRGNTKLSTANSIWFRDQKNFTVEQNFLQTNADWFGAAAYRAAFDQSTVADINAWVKDNTDGMIPELIKVIPPNAMMYLINAVAFDAKWETGYQKEQIDENGEFHAADGSTQNAVMLHANEHIFLAGDRVQGFIKPYQDGYSFAALLPDEGVTPEKWLADTDCSALQSILWNADHCKVVTEMPEFSYDYDTELSQPLIAMGMGKAFSYEADFSGISKDMGLMISAVLHKTHIELNADGTKAAAATAIEMRAKSAAPAQERVEYVTLDRPFVYMIIDNTTNLPIFIGILNSVQ